jgi:uncharacterized membrane protein YccC
MAGLSLGRRARKALTLSGRDREGVVQAAKMAIAAVLAWLAARHLQVPQSFIAPYAAVFMMSGSVYRSLFDAARQVTTVVLGVVVAFVVAVVIPWPLVELAVAVFVGMVVGRWSRLGRDGIWVGVVALLMITYGTADNAVYLAFRAGEALFGALVGVAVNVLILPPLHLRVVGRAVAGVSAEIEELLQTMAGELREDWAVADAQRWRRRARSLETVVRRAEEASGDGWESLRFNPRRFWSRSPHPATADAALSRLYEVASQVQHITETLVTSADPNSSAPRTGRIFNETFAALLDELARGVATYQQTPGEHSQHREAMSAALQHAQAHRAALARVAPWPEPTPNEEPPKDWSAHAAALLAVERAFQALLNT